MISQNPFAELSTMVSPDVMQGYVVVMAILMWSVVQKIIRPDANGSIVFVVTILAASSIGALNEIIEFIAVIALDSDGVGGYTNTAIDLVANLLGAIVGTAYARRSFQPL